MSYTRLLGRMIGGAAMAAAWGAASGAMGASILDDNGYTEYNSLEATQMGAAGGAVVGASIGLVTYCAHLLKSYFRPNQTSDSPTNAQDAEYESLGILAASVGLTVVGGVLGNLMLKQVAEMPLDKTAAAMGVGGSIMVLIAGCCGCVYVGGFRPERSSEKMSSIDIEQPATLPRQGL